MTECRQIESLLPPFVDGEADARERPGTSRRILRAAAACREPRRGAADGADGVACARGAAERSRRRRVCARAGAPRWRVAAAARSRLARWRGVSRRLPRPPCSPGASSSALRARDAALERAATRRSWPSITCAASSSSWRSTEHADARAARSSDTLRPVWLVDSRSRPRTPRPASRWWRRGAARSGSGDHAHLLYRSGDQEVSLYVTPGGAARRGRAARPRSRRAHLVGGGSSYAVVAGDVPAADLQRIAAYLEQRTVENR